MPIPQFIDLPLKPSREEVPGAATISSSTIQSETEQEKTTARKKSTPIRTPTRTPTKHEHKHGKKTTRKKTDPNEIPDEEDDDDDEELENEVALIRREYRVKQMIEQTMKKPHHHHTQRNSITTTRLSTPTYSSSLPSENSLSSPGPVVSESNGFGGINQEPLSKVPSARSSLPHQSNSVSTNWAASFVTKFY